MNDMKEKAMGAVRTFSSVRATRSSMRPGRGPRASAESTSWRWTRTGPWSSSTPRSGSERTGFPEAHRARGLREALAATWLAGNGDDYADTPVRFDEVAMMVVKENRALLRHHINCFGEMEPLS